MIFCTIIFTGQNYLGGGGAPSVRHWKKVLKTLDENETFKKHDHGEIFDKMYCFLLIVIMDVVSFVAEEIL